MEEVAAQPYPPLGSEPILGRWKSPMSIVTVSFSVSHKAVS